MFACALYPGGPEFLASVEAEAEYQVKRLANRACLALWCGNNEIEQMPGGDHEDTTAKKEPTRSLLSHPARGRGAL